MDEDMGNTMYYADAESVEADSEVSDVEWELEHLEEYDNVKQLQILKKEINHYTIHGVTPSEGWFDERFRHIDTYSKLDWIELAQRFKDEDKYMHDSAHYIRFLLDELIDERATKPTFNLTQYNQLLHIISNVWEHYVHAYLDDNTDADIDDLLVGITNL